MVQANGDAKDLQAGAEPLLVCRDLEKSFTLGGQTVRVLAGVSLTAAAGQTVVVAGRTGAGKSTLLSLLAGLDRPDAGSVTLQGRRMEELSGAALARLRREKIGVIFQSFNLLPSWTAYENVEAALLHTLPARARRERVMGLLKQLHLEGRVDNLPSQLSVGQQQCVAIARALANGPALIVADEPTGDVDDQTGAEIVAHLAGAVRKGGACMVVATHGAFPLALADRAYWLEAGRLSHKK